MLALVKEFSYLMYLFVVEAEESTYTPILDLLRIRYSDPNYKLPGEGDSDDHATTPVNRNPKARQIVEQLDLQTGALLRRYASQGLAMEAMKGTQAVLSACCRGHRSSAFGFGWRTYTGPPIDGTTKYFQ